MKGDLGEGGAVPSWHGGLGASAGKHPGFGGWGDSCQRGCDTGGAAVWTLPGQGLGPTGHSLPMGEGSSGTQWGS